MTHHNSEQGATGPHRGLSYRPEIDGLRAVAVLAVLLYHAKFQLAGMQMLPGGFLGVDVFFVISGYLITRILLRDLVDGRVSISAFYERRVRRILPALCLVLLTAIPFAWLVLLPDDLIEFVQSLAATNLFVSNVFFWTQDPYTAAPSLLKPLLHTWSLGVEEQFYLFFPLALIWLHKQMGPRLAWALGLLFLSSLVFADWSSRIYPSAGFFLLPQRLWELLAGSIIAVIGTRPSQETGARGLSTLGLGLIVSSLLLFDDQTRHPSLWTLIPVGGTALILRHPGRDSWTYAFLQSRIATGIGLISYSLYLWHQPIFAFARISSPDPLTPGYKLILLGGCSAAAFASWKFIEVPCRNRDALGFKTLASMLACLIVGFLAFAFAVQTHGGYPERFPSLTRATTGTKGPARNTTLDLSRTDHSQNGLRCHNRTVERACRFSSGRANETWFLVGDSNAAQLSEPLWDRIRARGTLYIPLTANACYYTPTLITVNSGKVQCSRRINLQRQAALLKSPPATVVLLGQLPVYYSGNFQAPNMPRVTVQSSIGPVDERQRKDELRRVIVDSTLELLEHGHRVVLIYPVPEVTFNVTQLFATSSSSGDEESEPIHLTAPYSKFRETTRDVYRILDSIGEHQNLIRIYPEESLCPNGSRSDCLIVDRGTPYYLDSFHLSKLGAGLLADQILSALPAPSAESAEAPADAGP